MKRRHYILAACLTCITASVIFTACQKSSSNTNGPSISATDALALQASAVAEDETDNVFNDAIINVMGVNDDAGLGGGIGIFLSGQSNTSGTTTNSFGVDSTGHCYTVTVDPQTPGVFPKTITIDFGTGCEGKDGHTRRGKLITVYTGQLKDAGSTATATFDGFYFDSVKVEGSFSIQNNSTAAGYAFTIAITNGKLSVPSGDFVMISRTHTWVQTEGASTPHITGDDTYSITGSSTGTAQVLGNVLQWSSNITQPVIRKLSCRWRVAGQLTITRGNKTGILDYGDGGCDNKAIFAIGSKDYEITLH